VAARAGLAFACVAASGIINDILKVAFGRARPDYWLAGDASGFEPFRFGFRFASFPSGHTATSVAAAVAFSALFPRGRLAFASFAILIATSRVALDAHYVSDVIGGATVGWLTARWVLQRRHRIGLPSESPQDSGSAIVN
jgi:membrane-associated phospholipid phosphatase